MNALRKTKKELLEENKALKTQLNNLQVKYNREIQYFTSIIAAKENPGLSVEPEQRTHSVENKHFTGGIGTIRDLTDYKLTSLALANSERILRNMELTLSNYVIRTDLQGRYTYMNPMFRDTFEWILKEQDLAITTASDTVMDYHKIRAAQTVEACILNPGKILQVELDKPTHDGGVVSTLWEFVCLTDDNGQPCEIQCSGIDITDRKQAEKRLQDSEIKYRTIFENVQDVYFETSLDGTILEISPSITILTKGMSNSDFIGKDVTHFYANPADRKRLHDVIETSGTINDFELNLKDSENNQIPISVTGKLIRDESGLPIKIAGTIRDIRERKKSENEIHELNLTLERKVRERTAQLDEANRSLISQIEERNSINASLILTETRLDQAMKSAGMAWWELDFESETLIIQQSQAELMGYPVTSPISLTDFMQLVHPDDIQKMIGTMYAYLNGESTVYDIEYRVKDPEGTYRWYHDIGAISERKEDRTPVKVSGFVTDITEKKRSRDFESELLKLTPKLTGISYSEIGEVLNLALERIGAFLGADRAYIFEIDEDKMHWTNTTEWCAQGIEPQMENLQNIPIGVSPRWMEKMQHNETFVIPSVGDLSSDWSFEKQALQEQGIQSLVAIPMRFENEFIGFFGLDYVLKTKEFSETELNNLNILGNLLSSLVNQRYREGVIEQTRTNYETFFNTIDDFLFVLDELGNILYTNETVQRRLKIRADVLIGLNVLMVHPEERRAEATEIINNMLRGTADVCPIPLITSSGKLIPVETRVKMGRWNGKPAVFGISKDVSALILSEEKFSKAFRFNNSYMAIVSFTSKRIIDVNDAFLSALGYSRQEVIGESYMNIPLFENKEIILQNEKKISLKEPVKEVEVSLLRKDRSLVICLMSADSVFIGDDLCLLVILTDISIRKKYEEDLLKTRMEAEAANQAKSEFLSRMSHELRTPLNAILGFAQLFQMGELTSLQSKGVDHILKSGNHLLDLINEILDISKIEAGRISLQFEPIQIKGIIQEIIDIIQVAASDNQITVKLTNSPLNRKFINSDRLRVKQILLNLINNAVKYNNQGGRVTVSTSLATQSGVGFIRISISDTGIGIAPENLAKLFLPFERIGAEKTSIEGTGLGLTVVKKLVEALNGKIGVESMLDQGSTFWFELPLSEYQIEAPGDQQMGIIGGEMARKRIGKILYIEDNQSNIDLVKQIILTQRPDISLIIIGNGEDALSAACEHQPDVIFLDLNLPDIHGREVLAILQTDGCVSNIPVIILTADAMRDQMGDLLSSGAREYMTKPLNVMAFLKIIDTYITKNTDKSRT